jgi:hypothetical protein
MNKTTTLVVVAVVAVLVGAAGADFMANRAYNSWSESVSVSVDNSFLLARVMNDSDTGNLRDPKKISTNDATGTGTIIQSPNQQSAARALVDRILVMRKDVKDKSISSNPLKQSKVYGALAQMSASINDLLRMAAEEFAQSPSQGLQQAMDRVPPKFLEFSIAAGSPSPSFGLLNSAHRRAVERTAGPLDDALRSLKSKLK